MANQEVFTDKRLLRKIHDRLAMSSAHSKIREGLRAEQVDLAREGPPPFLFQG
jgi:hypothetical protein